MERWLEAYDLYREGYAPLIMLSPERAEAAESLIRSRGITFPSTPELQRNALVQLGVPAAAILAPAGWVDNTAQEGDLLGATATGRGWKRVIVVTAKRPAAQPVADPVEVIVVTAKRPTNAKANADASVDRTPPAMPIVMPKLELAAEPLVIRL